MTEPRVGVAREEGTDWWWSKRLNLLFMRVKITNADGTNLADDAGVGFKNYTLLHHVLPGRHNARG